MVYNVIDFGAVGDDIHDDTPAIQAAINAAVAAGRGEVYLPRPPVAYRVQPQQSGAEALYITNPKSILIRGDGSSATKIKFYVFGGGDPSTSWEVIDGEVHRGSGLRITTPSNPWLDEYEAPYVGIFDLEFDGGAYPGNTGDRGFPADPITGDGWDITHKGIVTFGLFNIVHYERVYLHNWRGEISWGDHRIRHFTCLESRLSDSNAQGLNMGHAYRFHVENNLFDNLGTDSMEGLMRGGGTFCNNRVENCYYGVIVGQFEEWVTDLVAKDEFITICGNHFINCEVTSIWAPGTRTMINDNLIESVRGNKHPGSAIRITPGFQQNPGWPNIREGIVVQDNQIVCSDTDSYLGIGIEITGTSASTITNLIVKNNTILAINDGVMEAAYQLQFQPGISGIDCVFDNNTVRGTRRYVIALTPFPFDNMPVFRGDDILDPWLTTSLISQTISPASTQILIGPVLSVEGSELGLIPTINATTYQNGHRCHVRGVAGIPVTFPQNAVGFRCAEDRLMDSLGKHLWLEFLDGVFFETSYVDLA